MFSTVGTKAVTRTLGFKLRNRPHRAQNGSRAAHIVFHLLHAVGRFDGDTTGIERDAFLTSAR